LLLGWFSSGRDEAARVLLKETVKALREGFIKGEISFVFVNRDFGESEESDRFLKLCEELSLKVLSLSSKAFLPEERLKDKEKWRSLYHEEVRRLIEAFPMEIGVLAGYMLIVSPSFLTRFPLINLHPALPWGPTGTWQEVIWELIHNGEKETGAMIHRVTEELDRGPVLSFFRISLRGPRFDPLWEELEKGRFEGLKEKKEAQLLFRLIREEEEKREIPLLILTLKALSEGRIGLESDQAVDLTQEVEAYLRRRG
jgi:phosphoribosylglycinamide formyltransferase-1